MHLIPLSPTDLPLGQPLPWTLLDDAGNCVLSSGNVIHDARDVDLVFRHGGLSRHETEPAQGGAEEGRASSGPLGLPVGTLLHVKVPGGSERAAASRLIGFIEQALFISWPQLGGREQPIEAGATLLLRGFSGQTIYSFRSTITAVCRSPFRYLVLSAPTQSEQLPVRKAARVPTRLAAFLYEEEGEAEAMQGAQAAAQAEAKAKDGERLVMLSDLSLGGALLQAVGPAPRPDSRVWLRFQLRTAAFDCEVNIPAWVRNVPVEAGDEGFPAFSVAFDSLGERELTLLHCFIYEQLLSGSRLPL